MGGFKNQKQEDFVNKLLAKTPFYANKHTNHLCKGLNWQAQHSTMKDARKRFEQELLANKQKDMEDDKVLRELEAENERFQSAQEMRKENTKRQFTDILKEQMVMDKMKRTIEKQEDQIGQDLVHFGPEDTNARITYQVQSKKDKQKFIEGELKKQMDDKSEMREELKKDDKVIDAYTIENTNFQL